MGIYNQIKNEGEKDKLWYKRSLKFREVGGHRKNRGGLICGGNDALNVIDTVDAVGFDPDMLADATAFEEGPGRLNEAAFLPICEADDLLGNFKAGGIEFSSVACTHFNQGMVAVEEGKEWGNEAITIDGGLNMNKFASRHDAMKDIKRDGTITWTIWKHEAEVLYPDLPDIAHTH